MLPVLIEYIEWYKNKFNEIRPDWYVFPFGKPQPADPTRHVTSFKTSWRNVRSSAKVIGRFHDNRHTLITELAESGAGDQTIMDIAGHVSKQMLKHYSHIRMEAKRTALESIVKLGKHLTPSKNGESLQGYRKTSKLPRVDTRETRAADAKRDQVEKSRFEDRDRNYSCLRGF